MTGLIADPGFDLSRTEEYKLSIQVNLDGFSFSVIHNTQKQLLALGRFHIELSSSRFLGRHFKEWVQSSEILQKKYNKTNIIYYSENFTFIPSEYYENNHQEIPGKIVLGNQIDNLFNDNYLPNASGYLIYPVSRNFSEEVEQLFPGIKLVHPAAIIDNVLNKLTDKKESTLAFYVGKKSFTLLIYTNSRLEIINNYSYESTNDVIYYTMAVVKKLKIKPHKTAVYLAGEVLPKGDIHNNLKRLFNRTIFFIPEIHFNSEHFREPLHRFIILF